MPAINSRCKQQHNLYFLIQYLSGLFPSRFKSYVYFYPFSSPGCSLTAIAIHCPFHFRKSTLFCLFLSEFPRPLSEGREFEKSVLKPAANVLSLVSTTEGGKHIIVQFERKKSHDHEQKKYNLLGDRMAYVN